MDAKNKHFQINLYLHKKYAPNILLLYKVFVQRSKLFYGSNTMNYNLKFNILYNTKHISNVFLLDASLKLHKC